MSRMLYALAPLALSAVYFFGWRAACVLAAVFAAGMATEWIMAGRRKGPVTMAGLVTCALYGLSLPPTTPMWIAAVGAVVAVLFGKEVFGGFGKNPFNPAIVGRAFVYICFPVELTGRFVPAFEGFPGGLARWSFESLAELPARLAETGKAVADAVSQASPMWANRELGVETAWWRLAMGNISGTFDAAGAERILSAGSMGEGCAVLIVLAGAYLLWTKTANWRLMLGSLAGVAVANILFRNVLGFDGLGEVPPVTMNLLWGTTLYVIVFMITEPVSAPKKRPAQLAYAFTIGFLIVVLRWRGIFVAAATFSILLGNLLGPLMDMAATEWIARKKARAAAAAVPAGEGAS
ncbi:MAG: RnfABCDGE type electron transport complex subunit D [Planctomycetota bacterium]